MTNDFDEWLYEAVKIYCSGIRKEPHEVYPYVDLTNAKICFMDGMSCIEFSKLFN